MQLWTYLKPLHQFSSSNVFSAFRSLLRSIFYTTLAKSCVRGWGKCFYRLKASYCIYTFPVCTKQFLCHPCSKTGVKLWTLKFEGISFDIFWYHWTKRSGFFGKSVKWEEMLEHFYCRHEAKHNIGFCRSSLALSCWKSNIYAWAQVYLAINKYSSMVLCSAPRGFSRILNLSYFHFPPARGMKATFDSMFSLANNQNICTRQR